MNSEDQTEQAKQAEPHVDPQALAALEAKAATLDSMRTMLETNGFDIACATNEDMVALLGQLVLGGVTPYVTQILQEVNELKATLEKRIDEFDTMTKNSVALMVDIQSAVDQQRSHALALANLNSDVTRINMRTVNISGSESACFFQFMCDFTAFDSYRYNMPDANTTKTYVQNAFVSEDTKKVLRYLGMLLKRVEYEEGWATH